MGMRVIDSQAFVTFLAFRTTWLSTQNMNYIKILDSKDLQVDLSQINLSSDLVFILHKPNSSWGNTNLSLS